MGGVRGSGWRRGIPHSYAESVGDLDHAPGRGGPRWVTVKKQQNTARCSEAQQNGPGPLTRIAGVASAVADVRGPGGHPGGAGDYRVVPQSQPVTPDRTPTPPSGLEAAQCRENVGKM